MPLRTARVLLVAAALLCAARAASAQQAMLDDALIPYLARHELPALAAAVVVGGKIVAAGAVGTRRAGAAIPVTQHDRFHAGSATMTMTALLAAMQVDAGRLLWSSTVGEVFHELAAPMNPALKTVTLEQLLSHTSGIAADNDILLNLVRRALLEDGDLEAQRYWLVREWSTLPLAATPGSQFAVATINYVIAGAMLERAARKSWEELITERVFDPLGLHSAGLGPQASLGRIDAPLGHVKSDGRLASILPGPNSDAPALLGPAGGAHLSVLDFARWTAWHAGKGVAPRLVRPETLEKVQGFAWRAQDGEETARPRLHHAGANASSLAYAWLDPSSAHAIVLMTNIATPEAASGLRALARELHVRYRP